MRHANFRAHSPLVMFGSVAGDPERLALIKNLTYFGQDLTAQKLPQWIFITPNMTSDGHDTSVTVAGTWTRNFLEPLLTNEYFMKVALPVDFRCLHISNRANGDRTPLSS